MGSGVGHSLDTKSNLERVDVDSSYTDNSFKMEFVRAIFYLNPSFLNVSFSGFQFNELLIVGIMKKLEITCPRSLAAT